MVICFCGNTEGEGEESSYTFICRGCKNSSSTFGWPTFDGKLVKSGHLNDHPQPLSFPDPVTGFRRRWAKRESKRLLRQQAKEKPEEARTVRRCSDKRGPRPTHSMCFR